MGHNDQSKQSTKTRAAIWSAFLQDVAAQVDEAVEVVPSKDLVVWNCGEHMNWVEMISQSIPNPREPAAPWLTRIGVNHYKFYPSMALLRRLGFVVDRSASGSEAGRGFRYNNNQVIRPASDAVHIEWTVFDHELQPFVAWLHLLIAGQLDHSRPIPVPPLPCHVFGLEGLRTTDYGWTATAWEASLKRKGKSGWLPGYAIPAGQVVPAAPCLSSVAG